MLSVVKPTGTIFLSAHRTLLVDSNKTCILLIEPYFSPLLILK